MASRPAEMLKPLAERAEPSLRIRIALWNRHQDADPARPIGLLRVRRKRPHGHRAAEQLDELPSLQLIEVHPIPQRGGTAPGRISKPQGSVSGVSRTFLQPGWPHLRHALERPTCRYRDRLSKSTALMAPPNRGSSNVAHILDTLVPVEEPFTASQADLKSVR